jgi:uncharacterized membrane protein YbhN (UPF0104 family)
VSAPASDVDAETPTYAGLGRKLIRGGIAVVVLVIIAVGLLTLTPGLSDVRSAIAGASGAWVAAAALFQLLGTAGAIVFIQLVYADVARSLTWRMGGAQEGANAVLPTAGSTAVGYFTLRSVGWGGQRFAERAAVQIIAPAAPNVLLIIVFGVAMGLGLVAGSSDWWLTWLPAALMALVIVIALLAARWGHRLAARTSRRWLHEGLHVAATGVTGTVEVLRRHTWRALGTWGDLLGSILALWACLYAVHEHLPFAVVAMGYLIGQIAQVIPIPGGIGAIDAGVTGALVLYGGDTSISAAGELISHGLALLIPIIVGAISFLLLPGAIRHAQHRASASGEPASTDTGGGEAGTSIG